MTTLTSHWIDQADSQNSEVITRVRRIQLDVLYAQLAQGLVTTVVNAAFLAYVQSSVVDPGLAWTWFTVIVVVSLARAGLLVFKSTVDESDQNTLLLERLFFVGVFTTACLWGSTAIILFPVDSVPHQAFIGMILAGMTAGAMGSFAASHRVFLTFMLPACLPYAVQLVYQGEAMQMAMGAMTFVFVVTTWITSKKTNKTTTEALRLRFENIDLVEQLEAVNGNLRREVGVREQAQQRMQTLMTEATAATKAKSQFLANMSHEIRTPMNGVIGMADILSRSQLDRRQRHQVSLIQNSAQTLLALLNDILDFSRIEAGRLELDADPFDIREAIGDAIDILAEQAQTKKLELAYEIDRDVKHLVVGDKMRLRQVLINLVGNAVKFTETGSVVLRVTNEGKSEDNRDNIHFEITDTGIGIEPQIRESLFDAFKQADSSISRRFGGSGLGLSISHHLVEQMGGNLECSSTPGKGSTFYFTVSLEGASWCGNSQRILETQLKSSRMLVAEENDVTLQIVSNYLKSWNVDVDVAQTGASVIAMLDGARASGSPYAAVISSSSLPDMSGLEVAARMRQSEDHKATKLVLLTPVNWTEDIQVLEARSIASTINKPVRQSQLFDALSRAVCSSNSKRACETNAQGSAHEPTAPRTFEAQVLVVEDNPINQEVVSAYLTSFGCTMDVADGGEDAVRAIQDNHYDIILMDCQMPNMDGFEATRIIREIEQKRGGDQTPIVALTAGAFAGDRDRCLASGMDDYLSKPFSEAGLSDMLHKWLGADRSNQTGGRSSARISGGNNSNSNAGEEERQNCLDCQQIETLRKRQPGLFIRLSELYQEYTPALVKKLHQAQEQADFAEIKQTAHALKSSSANVAAVSLSELCQLMEVHAQKNDIERAKEVHAKFTEEYARVIAALKREVESTRESMELAQV